MTPLASQIPAHDQNSLQSQPAAVVARAPDQPIGLIDRMRGAAQSIGDDVKGMSTESKLTVAEIGTGLLGMPGLVISSAISFFTASEHARNEMNALTDKYRDVIAAQLQMPADKVSVNDLFRAAQTNKTLLMGLEHITQEQKTTPLSKMAAIPGGFAGAAAMSAVVPGAGMVLGMAGMLGGAIASSTATERMIGANEAANPVKLLDAMKEKRTKEPKESVTVRDVFAYRALVDDRLALSIKDTYGKPFHELSRDVQVHAIEAHPYIAQHCAHQASAINYGKDPAELMLGHVEHPLEAAGKSAGGWASRVSADQAAQPLAPVRS